MHMRIEKIYFCKIFKKFPTWKRSKSRYMTYIYMSSARNVLTRSSEKKFVLKRGFLYPGTSRNSFWKKNFFESGSFNPFRAAVFFENRQFLLKILKISKCSSSLNFWARRKLNPFLESLEPPLSDAHADREDLFSKNFQNDPNVKKIKNEDFGIYICHP